MPDEAFSSIDLVAQCLIDEPRSLAFKKAIESTVTANAHVLDIGTGSGLLAMFAAKAGSAGVTAIEFDPYVAEVARKNISANGLSDKITLLAGDGRNYEFPSGTHFDVVIMEMLTTGMVDEFQVQAANNLQARGVVNSDTVFVPKSQQTLVELTHKDFGLYGLEFRMVQHLWNNLSENQKFTTLSEKVLLNDISFGEKNTEDFRKSLSITPTKTGVANSIRLSSRAFLTKDMPLEDTETFNAPVVFPIAETEVQVGRPVTLTIAYRFGGGYRQFRAEF